MARVSKVLAAVLLVALAGCVAPGSVPLEEASSPSATGAADEPVGAFEWEGRVLVSAAEGLAHSRELTPVLKPVLEEGFTVDIAGAPRAIRVELFWNSTGVGSQFWIRAHSPHAASEEGHAVKDYNSESSGERRICVEIDPAEVVPGHWIFMGRPSDRTSFAGTFTMRITSPGATVTLYEEPHGHPMTDLVGVTGDSFEEGTLVDC